VSLDETYERILEKIPKHQKDHAFLILQCLIVATRALRVEELAQLLTFDISNAKAVPGMTWGDYEPIVRSACSNLILFVDVGNSQVVQFSHLSVKEFLTLRRPDKPNNFYIHLKPAHLIMAQVCLGLLCHLDDTIDEKSVKNIPLIEYATKHWVDHAKFEGVLPDLQDEVDRLLDENNPHFSAWLWAREEIPHLILGLGPRHPPKPLETVPLYYVAELGFCCLVQYLVSKRPKDVNAIGGRHGTPLHAAVYNRHVEVLQHLVNVANVIVDIRDPADQTPLHMASHLGYADIGRVLLKSGADINAREGSSRTPLHLAIASGHLEFIRMLLDHNARLLLHYGADWNARWDGIYSSPLHLAASKQDPEVANLLLEYNANVDMRNNNGQTPLYHAVWNGNHDTMRLLLEHDADANAEDNTHLTLLHLATSNRDPEAAKLLLEHGANIHACSYIGHTPLHHAVWHGSCDVMRLLLQRRVEVDAKDNTHSTPLHLAAFNGDLVAVQLLLEHSADIHARDKEGKNPLTVASVKGHQEVIQLLLERMKSE